MKLLDKPFKKHLILPVVSTGLLLSACAGDYDVDQAMNMMVDGNAFASALHKRYIERAQFEVDEMNWESVRFFNQRAIAAASGDIPAPQSPIERNLKKDADAIGAGHTRLVNALADGAASNAPDACALSQTWLEHWMEQSEEGHQDDDISAARAGFEAAIPDCKPADKPMAKPAPMPAAPEAMTYVIYFDFDSADLNDAAKGVANDIVAAVRAKGYGLVELSGHADRAGGNAYNDQLAQNRVEAVRAALTSMSIKTPIAVAAFGENRPDVATDDGMPHAKNRRVEVTLK